MTLKEAFTYVNELKRCNEMLEMMLMRKENFTTTVEKHNISRAVAGAENYEETVIPERAYNVTGGALLELLCDINAEFSRVSDAISVAKQSMNCNIDMMISKNSATRRTITVLERVLNTNCTSTKRLEEYYGTDNEGKQAIFKYPVIVESKFDFDKNYYQNKLSELKKTASAISTEVDKLITNTEVNFIPKWTDVSLTVML